MPFYIQLRGVPSHDEARHGLGAGTVVVDVVRTDLVPPRHLSFFLEIPVVLPVTRSLA